MKKCPVVGCDVTISDADVVCPGCLSSVSREFRSTFFASWRAFSRSFSAADMAAYERAARAVIVDAGQRKRPSTLPFDSP